MDIRDKGVAHGCLGIGGRSEGWIPNRGERGIL